MAGFPFCAIPLLDDERHALLALAVDPHLKGAVILGPNGAGRSFLLHAFLGFLARVEGHDTDTVKVPPGTDRDALLGGIDLQASLVEGRIHRSRGLLERARERGLLFVEDLGLLGADVRNPIKTFLDAAPAMRMVTTATTGEPPPAHFVDPLPFRIRLTGDRDATIVRRRLEHERDPEAFAGAWAAAEEAMVRTVREARARLAGVGIGEDELITLARAATSLGVHGSRADIAAARAARAHAALRGVAAVDDDAVSFAVRAVLAPRATVLPAAPPEEGRGDVPEASRPEEVERRPDEVIDTAPAATPPTLEAAARAMSRRHGGGGGRVPSWQRGAVRGASSRPRIGRHLALAATLRLAAQRGHVDRSGTGPRVRVRPDDLRFKRRVRRAGTLFVIAVDGSGSMAFHRMAEAKGCVEGLLRQAYQRRDAVALVTFRGDGAEVVLPRTTSVERARRCLAVVPTGGGTPLAAGLEAVVKLARRERDARLRDVAAVIVTDGRPNVPRHPVASGSRAAAVREMEEVAPRYAAEGIPTTVVDTSPVSGHREDAARLAVSLGALYLRL